MHAVKYTLSQHCAALRSLAEPTRGLSTLPKLPTKAVVDTSLVLPKCDAACCGFGWLALPLDDAQLRESGLLACMPASCLGSRMPRNGTRRFRRAGWPLQAYASHGMPVGLASSMMACQQACRHIRTGHRKHTSGGGRTLALSQCRRPTGSQPRRTAGAKAGAGRRQQRMQQAGARAAESGITGHACAARAF